MFEIGKEIMAIESHPQGKFKKGDVFTLLGMKQCNCKCKDLVLDIGLLRDFNSYICRTCGNKYNDNVREFYFSAKRFVPIDDICISELTEVLEKEVFSV